LERAADQPRDVHLRDPDLLRDLRLGQPLEEAQVKDRALALVEDAETRLEDGSVLGDLVLVLLGAERLERVEVAVVVLAGACRKRERAVLLDQLLACCEVTLFVIPAEERLVALLGHFGLSTLSTRFSSSIQPPPSRSTAANRSTTVSSTRRRPTPSPGRSSSARSPSSPKGPSAALTVSSPTSSSTVSSPSPRRSSSVSRAVPRSSTTSYVKLSRA